MPIKFTMGTKLVKVKVGGGNKKWIKVILFMMKPTMSPTFFLSFLLNKIQ
jgi:hypothetical protein